MNCIIIDDDEACRTVLEQMIGQTDPLKHVGSYENGIQAINALKNNDTHLVFLDVEMPEMNGIDMLAELEIKPLVILTTSHKEYALDAYEHEVVDYLVKPVTLPRFLKAVSKAERQFENLFMGSISNDRNYFFIRKDTVIHKVPIADVLWVEAMGDYVTINTKNKKIILHSTLRTIESKLPKDKFIRVHRSYIVQIENIKTVEGNTIFIDDTFVPLGTVYKDSFLKRLGFLG
ncbi:MAG TPA: LytTR family DNA-binding domain-containing protein [Bacteroidia bacterium]|jgi:two-component system response regulator LytT|nr:LytTR family DNA-binding domain-containing protein [Bacteroidia bacterium]